MSEIIRDITEVARCAVQYRTDRLASVGLKSIHASYLVQICANPGISQDGLAKRIFINKSNVARQAAALEEQGFILRKPSTADKRVMELYPTEKAQEVLPLVREVFQSWEAHIAQDFTAEELELMSVLLKRMKIRSAAYMEDR